MVPVYPDFGVYINALLSIIFPAILFVKLNTCLYKHEFKKYRGKQLASIMLSIPALTMLCVIIGLISGVFKYYAIAIGSGSMTPNVNKGDAVVAEKLSGDDFNNLAINDIIIYQHDNKLVVHRIVKIKKNGTTLTFNTKGDHNDTMDAWDISISDIRGKVVYKIDYIGYPSVWLSENLNK
jgi:signal peptidase I